MNPEERTRTLAARQELSPRQTIVKAFDALSHAEITLTYGLSWTRPEDISKRTLLSASDQAQLAADLLKALAERAE